MGKKQKEIKIFDDELDNDLNSNVAVKPDIDEFDDSIDMVSPDQAIFTKVEEELNTHKAPQSFTATWHGTEDQQVESFDVDDSKASSINADMKFMKAFGLSETGTHRTINALDKNPKTSEFAKDDIYSNEYEYTDVSQKNEIIEMYQYARRSLIRKIVFSMIFLAIAFFIENVAQFFTKLEYFSNI